jgi:hypothetical protein
MTTRQRDAPDALKLAGAEIFGGLLERAVDARKNMAGEDVEIDGGVYGRGVGGLVGKTSRNV